ncbi:MAG TPA: hypothetical protein DDW52_27075 [Planctomycetaceae bacterium]|nr:hypothetical protein [Planctomycetaceae bacterium]
MFSFGLKQILISIAIGALTIVAVAADQPWIHFLGNLLVVMLLAAQTLGALLLQGPRKTAALGAAVFGWAYISTIRISGVDSIADHLIPIIGLEDRQRTTLLLSIRTLSILPVMLVGQRVAIRLKRDVRHDVSSSYQ